MPTIEPIFKCPKCKRHNIALRTKKDSSEYYLSCLGKPECNHVIWLPNIIKEFRVDQSECQRCGGGTKKVLIRFKTFTVFGMLNDSNITEDNNYLSCILCDGNLRGLLDIDDSSIRSPPNNAPQQQRQNNPPAATNNRPSQPLNASTNNRQPNPPPNNWNNRTNNTNNTRPNYGGNTNTGTNPNPNANRSLDNDPNIKCPHCNLPAKQYEIIFEVFYCF